jgi:3-oxoacyl-[acyl-carrier protein] reductase
MFELTGRKALVTGASGGIGEAIARVLHAQGAVVGLHGTRVEKLETLAAELGDRVKLFPANLSNRDEVKALGQKVEADLEGVDILVNNAGITKDGVFHRMSGEQWSAVISTNLDSMFTMTRPVIEGMRERSFGRVINISSINGQKGQFGQANYSAAKAGIIGFTKALAQENAAKGIAVNCICPGYISTEMVAAMPADALKKVVATIPVGRLGEAEEIADLVVYLASDKAGFFSGSVLTINGGQYIANG